MPFTSQFAELFSVEISFWLLQQQLIHNTIFLDQEGEQWMPYRPPTIENYPPWDNFSLKRGREKLAWVISPPNCGCEQRQETSASMWILDLSLHVLNGSAALLQLHPEDACTQLPSLPSSFSNTLPSITAFFPHPCRLLCFPCPFLAFFAPSDHGFLVVLPRGCETQGRLLV